MDGGPITASDCGDDSPESGAADPIGRAGAGGGEVFVVCAEKTGLPGFGFFRQGNNYALLGAKTAPGGKNATRRTEGWRLGLY